MLVGVDVKQNFEANIAQNKGPKKGNTSEEKGFGNFRYNSGYGCNENLGNNGYRGEYGNSGFVGNAFGTNAQHIGYQGDNKKVRRGNWNQNVGPSDFNNSRSFGNTKPQ